MAKFTVDLVNSVFIVKAGVTSFDVQVDLYSDAKEHWLSDSQARGINFPLRTVAGDTRSDGSIIEPFYFMRDGWKIRPDEVDHTLAISGNIELDAGEAGGLIVPTLGAFTVLATANTTNRGTISSGSAAAVLDEIVEGTITLRQAQRLLMSIGFGKTRDFEINAPRFRDLADSKDRVTASQDANGNRTSVTVDPT